MALANTEHAPWLRLPHSCYMKMDIIFSWTCCWVVRSWLTHPQSSSIFQRAASGNQGRVGRRGWWEGWRGVRKMSSSPLLPSHHPPRSCPRALSSCCALINRRRLGTSQRSWRNYFAFHEVLSIYPLPTLKVPWSTKKFSLIVAIHFL